MDKVLFQDCFWIDGAIDGLIDCLIQDFLLPAERGHHNNRLEHRQIDSIHSFILEGVYILSYAIRHTFFVHTSSTILL